MYRRSTSAKTAVYLITVACMPLVIQQTNGFGANVTMPTMNIVASAGPWNNCSSPSKNTQTREALVQRTIVMKRSIYAITWLKL